MVKLTEALVLARSRATDVENVRKLNCWGSELSDIRIIRRMTQVQILSLSVNNISTLSDFSHCTELEELYIRKNRIADINELSYLRALPKLRVLWLADNPCAAENNYRMTVLKNLPNLSKLDNIAVQQEELNSAIEEGDDLLAPIPPSESLDVRPMRALLADTPAAGISHAPSIVSTSMPAFSILESRGAAGDNSEVQDDKSSGAENGKTSTSGAENGKTSSDTENSKTTSSGAENGKTPSVAENGETPSEEQDTASGPASSDTASHEAGTSSSQTARQDCATALTMDEHHDTSWEETNKIRVQLGLKPLPVERVTQMMKPRSSPHSSHGGAKQRNANLLQAALHLVKELDPESLDVLSDAIRNRLEDL